MYSFFYHIKDLWSESQWESEKFFSEEDMKKIALHNLGCKVNAYETEAMQAIEKVHTPGMHTIEQVCEFLHLLSPPA